MLKEKLLYNEGIPVNCTVAEIEDYPIHFHDDPEIIFVLDGSIILKNGYYTYTLQKDDIFIMNDREIHSYYKTGESNAVMIVQLDQAYFLKYYEILKNSFFITDTKDKEDESLERLRALLARIAHEYLTVEPGHENNVTEIAHNLINCLITDFQHFAMEDGKFVNESKSKGNKILTERVNRITEYMYENYARRLTLKEIAEREHLSVYYLSHVIKEATGLSFQELLNFIRVEESEKLLLGTDKKIGAVSIESGFSAVRYFIKYFIKWFGMHPSDYRKTYTGHVHSRETSARMTELPSVQVEKLIRQYTKDLYNIIGDNIYVSTEEIDVKSIILSGYALGRQNFCSMFEREHLKPAAGAYELLMSLNEQIIFIGSGYVISKVSDRDKYSILFFNFCECAMSDHYDDLSLSQMKDAIESHNIRSEILVKLNGLTGGYRIARLRFSKECILSGYLNVLGEEYFSDRREEMINTWTATPEAIIAFQYAIDGLNVQSCLNGFSTELVMIDPL